jgi:DNA polymerase bacteriophage-type
MHQFHLDYETVSSANLPKLGSGRYAADADAAIVLCAVTKNDEDIYLWDKHAGLDDNMMALCVLEEMAGPEECEIWAHNAIFELMITENLWEKTFGFPPPPAHRWRCTQALCRSAAIPSSLEKAAEYLKLDVKKDKMGKALIRKFCVPQTVRKTGEIYWIGPDWKKPLTLNKEKYSAAAAWQVFRDYCVQDVRVEREIHQRLKILEFKGWILDFWKLDLRLNIRGVPVNRQAAMTAVSMIEEYTNRVTGEFQDLTGLSPTQGAKFLAWLKERGYPLDDLRIDSVTAAISGDEEEESDDDLPEEEEETLAPALFKSMTPEAVQALRIKVLLGFAALKKLPTMLNACCADGRLRAMFKFWGAIRTGRYSSNVVQLQNLKRPTSVSEELFKLVRAGLNCAYTVDLFYGHPMKTLAGAIRHFIGFEDGRGLIVADYSQIEARVLPWLAGHTKLLEAFRAGLDLYEVTVADALGIDLLMVTKAERQLGKVLVLACGYAGGEGAMSTACDMYKIEMEDKEKRRLVKAWRKANAPITKLWDLSQDAAVEAILNPGKWFPVNDKVKFGVTTELGYKALVMQLPSGRRLQYPEPWISTIYKIKKFRKGVNLEELEEGDDGKEWVPIPEFAALDKDKSPLPGVWVTQEISYYGPMKGSSQWGRVRTHGGVFVENMTQATAGDLLAYGSINSEKAGYAQILTVHDEIVTEDLPGNSPEGLVEAMCKLPDWAADFPIGAVGERVEFYTK